jgi:outer membrane receptor protein involved in Fe transport
MSARLLALVSLSVMLVTVSMAQTASGNLEGNIRDASGAVLQGVQVSAINTATGAQRVTTTNEQGTFVFTNLPPNQYQLVATHQGFADQKIGPVTVNVGATTQVQIGMALAEVSSSVTVKSETPEIDVQNVTVQSIITQRQLDSLPTNGRNFQQLAILSPMADNGSQAVGTSFDSTKTRVGAISVGGGPGRYINISIDGGDANDDFVGGQNLQISQDAVQEFSIATQRFNAEDGRATQGIINVITKSGTNKLHGTGFWFFRDAAISNEKQLDKQLGLPKPDFRKQQYGATLGGPIKRDKVFFFGSYERQQETQFATYNSNGAFPTVDGQISQPFWQNMYLAKLTVQLTPSLSFFGRYTQENNNLKNDQAGVAGATPGAVVNIKNDYHTVIGGLTKVMGRSVNDARFQYSDYVGATVDPHGNENAPTLIFPDGVFGHNPQAPQFNIERKYQWSDTLSLTRSHHTVRLGAEYIRQPEFGGQFGFGRNEFFYANDDFDPQTGVVGPTNSIVGFSTFSQPLGNALNPPLNYVAFFAQDEWRPTPRVTLNLGLRYDFEKNLFIPRNTDTNQLLYPLIGTPHDRYHNFAPRVGVAFDVTGDRRTVVNAGYGLYYEYQAITSVTLYEALNQLPNPFEFISIPPPVPFGPSNIPDFTGASGFTIGFSNSPDLRNPRVHEINAGISHEFTQNTVLESNFVASLGRDFPVFTQNNYPGIGPVQIFVNGGHNRYLAWATQIRYRARRLEFQASYRLSQSKTNQDSTQGSAADGVLNTANWQNDPTEYGYSNFDERHHAVASLVWNLPHGVTTSSIMNVSSGRAYTPICNGCDANGDGFTGFFGIGDRTGPRGSLRGDSTFTLDVRGAKSFTMPHETSLELIFEVFNLTNRANYGSNFNRITAPDGTIIPGSGFGQPIDVFTPPRQAQVAARFKF